MAFLSICWQTPGVSAISTAPGAVPALNQPQHIGLGAPALPQQQSQSPPVSQIIVSLPTESIKERRGPGGSPAQPAHQVGIFMSIFLHQAISWHLGPII